MWDQAALQHDLVQELWLALNRSVLTSFLHGASGPAGNPGGIERCSPPDLLGPCNATCAAKYFSQTQHRPFYSDSCNMTLLMQKESDGNLIKKVSASSASACCQICSSMPDCNHFVFNPDDYGKSSLHFNTPTHCHLKSGSVSLRPGCSGCVVGTKDAPPPGPTSCPRGSDFPICGIPGC